MDLNKAYNMKAEAEAWKYVKLIFVTYEKLFATSAPRLSLCNINVLQE